jgi:hypothetical protein
MRSQGEDTLKLIIYCDMLKVYFNERSHLLQCNSSKQHVTGGFCSNKYACNKRGTARLLIAKLKTKLCGLIPQANCTDRATSACWQS